MRLRIGKNARHIFHVAVRPEAVIDLHRDRVPRPSLSPIQGAMHKDGVLARCVCPIRQAAEFVEVQCAQVSVPLVIKRN